MKGLFQCPPWATNFCPFRAWGAIERVQLNFNVSSYFLIF